ncbi:Tankyrase-like Protein [Gryllus bimaculatus]|nr:Tankyrase-like Protein [Gryllus bimaculatus]
MFCCELASLREAARQAEVGARRLFQGGKTPLYIAARGSFTAIVDMIIRTARLDYPQPDGDSPEAGLRAGKWRHSCDGHASNERLRDVLWKVASKQLSAGEWKRLAHHWAFTDDQIKAIEHQYTGPSSYKEHGFRMMLIWAHSLPPQINPMKELCDSLVAIGKKSVAGT